jgi:uncharacterized membrane protein
MSVHVKGHPIHAMLVGFPVGLLVFAFVFDVIYAATGRAGFATVAYYDMVAGIVTAVGAALFGFADFTQITDVAARETGLRHMVVNGLALALYLLSFLLRAVAGAPPTGIPWKIAFGLSLAATLTLTVGGWLGGELVYRHRVGVGIDPYLPDPAKDEAGNTATDFQDFPTGAEPGIA